MQHKPASIISIIVTLLLFVAAPAALVYVVDPFQIYHPSFFEKAGYSKEQSYQHAGWINQLLADPAQQYNSVIIGSSTAANYTQTMINQKMPWGKTLNLSVNGSTPWMQHTIAQYALEKNPGIQHILFDIHPYFSFDVDPHHGDPEELKFPAYLYNNNILDDKPYLFNVTNVITAIKFLRDDFNGFSSGVEDNGPFYQDLLSSDRYAIYASQEYRKNTLLPQLSGISYPFPDAEFYKNKTYSSIDKYLLSLIKPRCNTAIDINILFSPLTRHSYASMADVNYLHTLMYMRRYVLDHTRECQNIKVYAFDNVDWMVSNLANYADSYHYVVQINEYIVESMSTGRHQLTQENIDAYENQFIKNINAYHSLFMSELKM